MNTTGTKKRTYDEQFKRGAVALLEGGSKAAWEKRQQAAAVHAGTGVHPGKTGFHL